MALPTAKPGQRIMGSFLVTLTGTVYKNTWVKAAGVVAGAGDPAIGVALEDGVSTQKIAVQTNGWAVLIIGSAGATAGAQASSDGSGYLIDQATSAKYMGVTLIGGSNGDYGLVNLGAQ